MACPAREGGDSHLERPSAGVGRAGRDLIAPLCQEATDLVGDEMAIDDLRELALQAAERLARGLVLGELASVVVAPGARMHRLDPRREVKRVVERAVTTARKSVAGHLAARDLDRRGAGVAREAIRRPEPGDVPDVAEDLGRQDVADADDVREGRVAGGNRHCAASPVLHECPVDPPQVGDERTSHRLALEVDDRSWSNVAEELRGPRCRQLGRGTAGTQITEQAVEPVDRPAALPAELVTAVRQEPQYGAVVLRTDAAQVRLVLGDRRHTRGIDAVGLAPVARSEEAGPGNQRRGDVQHRLLACDELLREKMTETRGAFDGPDPLGPPLRPAQEPLEGGLIRETSQLAQDASSSVERDRSMRRLVGIDADRDHLVTPRAAGRWSAAAGNLNSGERLTPLSSHAGGGRWSAGSQAPCQPSGCGSLIAC